MSHSFYLRSKVTFTEYDRATGKPTGRHRVSIESINIPFEESKDLPHDMNAFAIDAALSKVKRD